MNENTYIPQPGEQWQHKNGLKYTVLFVTNTTVERPGHAPDVVYQGDHGSMWSRPLADWHRSMTLWDANKPATTYTQQMIRAIRAYRERCREEYGHDGFGVAEHVINLALSAAIVLDQRHSESGMNLILDMLQKMTPIAWADMIVKSGQADAVVHEISRAYGWSTAFDGDATMYVRPIKRAGMEPVTLPVPCTIADLIGALHAFPLSYEISFTPGDCVDMTDEAVIEVLEGTTSDGPGSVWLKLLDR